MFVLMVHPASLSFYPQAEDTEQLTVGAATHLQLQVLWLILRERNDGDLGNLVDFMVSRELPDQRLLPDEHQAQREIWKAG